MTLLRLPCTNKKQPLEAGSTRHWFRLCRFHRAKYKGNTDIVPYYSIFYEPDLVEIVPEVPYTDADLDWMNPKSRSSLEMKDPSSRPAIKKESVNSMNPYETIYLGFPIWWYTAPSIIHTFLEANDFQSKKNCPLCYIQFKQIWIDS